MAGARIGEKAVHLKANISLLLHHIIHHTHDPLSNDCLKTTVEAMAAAPHVKSIHQQKISPSKTIHSNASPRLAICQLTRSKVHQHVWIETWQCEESVDTVCV